MLRLNIGSGQRKFGQGWTNVDINPKWSPDVVADGASMPMFADDSADYIALHHTVEHYGCGEATALIQECYRILCPGGSLIVAVPDMRNLVDMWVKGMLTTQVFMTNVYGAYMDSEADRHKFGYDRLALTRFLFDCADWRSVQQFDWRGIIGADIARANWILCLEAIK